jgi:hypothetical protein
MRNATVRAIWACADLLSVVQGGLIMLASRVVEYDGIDPQDEPLGNTHASDYPRRYQP